MKKQIIKFYSKTCGPCKILNPVIEEVKKEYPDVKVIPIDVDEDQHAAMNHRIRSVPTMIFVKDDTPVFSFNGTLQKQDLCKLIDEHLN